MEVWDFKRGLRSRSTSSWNAGCRAGSFFYALFQLGPGLGDDQLGVLVAQGAEAGVAFQRLAENWEFLGADMAGDVLAVAPDLELEIRAGVLGTTGRAILGEFAELHGVDLGDLSEEICW